MVDVLSGVISGGGVLVDMVGVVFGVRDVAVGNVYLYSVP